MTSPRGVYTLRRNKSDTGAMTTNYADSQMDFEGSLAFELQGIPSIWNLIGDWLINQRVFPQSLILSPNGLAIQSFIATDDPRTGAWLNSAAFTINAGESIKVSCDVKALIRNEQYNDTSYRARSGKPGSGVYGVPTAPLNPSPFNRNPFPGWAATTQIVWPGSPPVFSDSQPTGMFMMDGDFTFNNNTQIVRGCTGLPNPAAVMQGVMAVEGNVNLFRDGIIADPYAIPNTPFTASGANLQFTFGSQAPLPKIQFLYILLMSEEFTIQGQNTIVPRKFGFAGLGNGTGPPMLMPSI